MLIVCGPTCSGKSTIGELAQSYGLSYIEGSIAVSAIYESNRLPEEDVIAFCRRWFLQEGRDVFARENHRRMVEGGVNLDKSVFIGCRTIEEVRYLSSLTQSTWVIGLYADATVRFQRYMMRKRYEQRRNFTDFLRQDMRDLDLGITTILAYAIDQLVVNNTYSLEEFEHLVEEIIHERVK